MSTRNNIRIAAVAAAAALAMLTTSCRSTRQAARAEQPQATEEAPTPARTAEHSMANFTATVEGISVNGQLRMVEDSAIWASAYKLIEVGRALATRDSVWLSAPLMGVDFAGSYVDLSRKAGRKITFAKLQEMARSADVGSEVQRLAAELGYSASLKMESRRVVPSVSMPYRKPNSKPKQ